MKNISNIKDCYGCGVCATICPKKIISISLNEDGFYVPRINEIDKCINCSLCLEVCAFSHKELSLPRRPLHSYAAWSNNPIVRKRCSSGGVGFELGKLLISKGYKVCGVKYIEDSKRAEHYIASTIEELIPSIGSKYIQSYTLNGLKAINKKEKYLVIGTPCQIDSFRRFIKKLRIEDNFVLMDFYCHGVISLNVWDKYLSEIESKIGKIEYTSWRNKFTAISNDIKMSLTEEPVGSDVDWHDSYNMVIKGKRGFVSSTAAQGNLYFKFFLNDICLNKACYHQCKYKYDCSSADIRIGDLWGNTYQKNKEGVSAAIAFTEKGNQFLQDCDCTLIEHPFETVAGGQMKKNLEQPFVRNLIIQVLKSKMSLTTIKRLYIIYTLPQKCISFIKRIILKFKI